MIPKILNDIVDYLKEYKLNLVKGMNDARMDSASSEGKIISALQNHDRSSWTVITKNINNNRHWCDFKCKDNQTKQEYFCDIKVSNLNSNDNMNAKKAIYWFLTGKNPDNVSPQHQIFFESMKNNECLLEERDFYYLVINKNNNKDIFVVSLKNINSEGIIGSHNNPPLQAKWDKCRKNEERSMQEAKKFFLNMWATTIKRHIEILNGGMPKCYPEYFNIQNDQKSI